MNDAQLHASPQLEIEMEVVFGTPSQNCIGSGICMVMSRLPRLHTLKCAHAPAFVSCNKGQLVFRFLKSKVTQDLAASRLEKQWFDIRETFHLPKHLARKLGMELTTVACGSYPVTETREDWTLKVNLSENSNTGCSRKPDFS